MKKIILLLLISLTSFANYLDDNLKKDNWEGVEIIWLVDNSFPTYDISIFFEGGAYDDPKGKEGLTALSLNLLTLGTNRYNQEHILDTLEFYGVSYGANSTHEYATYDVSGLVKDVLPTMKMVCHMFRDATYPKKELKKSIKRLKTAQRRMITNHGALASYISRIVTLRKTGFERPADGNLNSYNRIKGSDLTARLKQLNNETRKRIYIRGPEELESLRNVFKNDCKWSNEGLTAKNYPDVKRGLSPNAGGVFLVPVKDANQAQVRIGTYMSKEEAHADYALAAFTSKFMGGGFTSRLMQALRVNSGLTYSAGSYASPQKNYGRKGISTFTKNETIVELLQKIDEVVKKNSKNIPQDLLQRNKVFVKGNYLYELESTSSFLATLQYYDTVGRPYKDIYQYPKAVEALTREQVQNKVKSLFQDPDNVTVIVGNISLKETLEKAGYKVNVIKAEDYL
tara:strand:- start:59117 stop:60481 length:1365 start_codon:yes stop_codon:yes gene_type:complete